MNNKIEAFPENTEDFCREHEMIFVLDDDFREYKSTGKYSIENHLKRLEEKRHQAEDKQE